METISSTVYPVPEDLPKYQQKWLQEVKSCILKKLDGPGFVIADIADALGISERQFHRRIKQLLGITPNELILQLKMDRARQLLEDGHYPTVAQVAYAVGFNRSDYFSHLFWKTYGKRPIELMSR